MGDSLSQIVRAMIASLLLCVSIGSSAGAEPIEVKSDGQGIAAFNVPLDRYGRRGEAGIVGYRALLFGAEDYGPGSGVHDLKTPNTDIARIGTVLREKFGFETKLYPDATRHDIIAALDEASEELGENDALIIYYAGHGVEVESEVRGYWLPVDADTSNSANWVSHDDVHKKVKSMRARHVLLISDSCFSGMFKDVLALQTAHQPESFATMLSLAMKPSRQVILSGSNEPVPDVGPDGMSRFAYEFVKLLQDSGQRYLIPDALFLELRERVMAATNTTPVSSRLTGSSRDRGGQLVMVNRLSCEHEREVRIQELNDEALDDWRTIVAPVSRAKDEALLEWLERWAEPRVVAHCGETSSVRLATDYARDAKLHLGRSVTQRTRLRRALMGTGTSLAVVGGSLAAGSQLWWQRNRDAFVVGDQGITAANPELQDAFRRSRIVQRVGIGLLSVGLVSIGVGSTLYIQPSGDGAPIAGVTFVR